MPPMRPCNSGGGRTPNAARRQQDDAEGPLGAGLGHVGEFGPQGVTMLNQLDELGGLGGVGFGEVAVESGAGGQVVEVVGADDVELGGGDGLAEDFEGF